MKYIFYEILFYYKNPNFFLSSKSIDYNCECETSSCDCTPTTQSCECSVMEEPIIGKGGANYLKHGAFCLETQKFPDAVNHVKIFNNYLNDINFFFFFQETFSVSYITSW